MIDPETLADVIKKHRKAARLSQIQLAEMAGVGKTVVYDIEKGKETIQLDTLRKTFGEELQTILKAGEEYLLVPYGNHSRGAKFLDVSDLIDEKLVSTINEICRQIPGFYFGRMDVRYNTWEELKQGKNFSIIELNGAGSEPTHMYDPKHSIFFAWKEIIRHWNILLKISMLNHKAKHIPYMTVHSGLQMFKENGMYMKMLQAS